MRLRTHRYWGAAAVALLAAGCPRAGDDGIAGEEPAIVEETEALPPSVVVEIHDAEGRHVLTATLAQADTGVALQFRGEGLPAGPRGIHFHQAPRCDPPGFESAGAHYNPFGRQHGMENPVGPHAGDLPNLHVRDDGTVDTTYVSPFITLNPGRPRYLFQHGGVSLVIHAERDDKRTDPEGNSGARIACGVAAHGGV
jgi:superoxide dismutase, Cu-Zn family